ncbi:MAG: efflux RND transporter periplasmic adaptor subunit, partial [Thiovulaceae bacterium]|nr:efflux RND transporter periplasmic adaptor subunit [Sulfurimonadaceae bacterium]
SKNIMTVPQKAVLQNPLGTTVFVVVNGKVVAKPVKILDTAGQNFVIAGVSPRDVVVVNNFFRIKPGASVIIDKTISK